MSQLLQEPKVEEVTKIQRDLPRRIFFDDVRKPPKGNWLVARTVHEFCNIMNEHQEHIEIVSLDHDIEFSASGYGMPNLDGTFLARWMADEKKFPKDAIFIHSSNPAGADRMRSILRAVTTIPVIRIDYMELLRRFNNE